jgi:pimeloyl-ACP methyl ester carboxylesterase
MDQTRRVLRADDGVDISYVVIPGSEPAAVILHGLAGSGREFVSTARALSGRKIILVDQRGHGWSTRLPSDTSRAAFVGDVVSVMDREASSPVHLIGHSMGAHTAMLAAVARPDLVRTLVLLECGEGSGNDQEHASIGEYFRSGLCHSLTVPRRQSSWGTVPYTVHGSRIWSTGKMDCIPVLILR